MSSLMWTNASFFIFRKTCHRYINEYYLRISVLCKVSNVDICSSAADIKNIVFQHLILGGTLLSVK